MFEGPALALGIGSALFVEAFTLFVAYLSAGVASLVGHPAYLGTRLGVALAAGVLAALAFRHARGRADRRERARRRLPPAADAPAADPPAADPARISGDGREAGSSGSGTSR